MSDIMQAECESAGLDVVEVKKIADGLSRYAKKARALDLEVFGGSGLGSLRFRDQDGLAARQLIIAYLDGDFDGGDGGTLCDDEGLLRGE